MANVLPMETRVRIAAALEVSKLVISYAVGKRDHAKATTDAFLADLRARVLVVPQITSDGLTLYVPAVEASFRGCAD